MEGAIDGMATLSAAEQRRLIVELLANVDARTAAPPATEHVPETGARRTPRW
jgi:hypothetical protein